MIDGQMSHCERFARDDTANCRIETRGGTVYWLSQADEEGRRWVVREHLQRSETNTMVMTRCSKGASPDLGDKFRVRLGGDVEIHSPLVLELTDDETRIVTEPVEAIEVGTVPTMIFDI